ncbi:MAG TPA: hypothetical protein VGK36_13880 [Candidatus Angelobacter sp.]
MAIIFKPAIFHRLMESLAYVVEHDPEFFIARHRKPDIIGATVGGQVRAFASIADITEIAQFGFGRINFLNPGAAGTRKPSP